MEKRFIVAIVLSAAVLFLWQAVFVKKPVPTPAPAVETLEKLSIPQAEPMKEAPSSETEPVAAVQEPLQPVSGEREQEIVVDTSLYRAIWSNKGAVLKSWVLKKYQDDEGGDLDLISKRSLETKIYPLFLTTDDESFDTLVNRAVYQPSMAQIELVDGETAELRLIYADDKGNSVEKIFSFSGGSYVVDVSLSVRRSGQPLEAAFVWGPSFGNLTEAELKNRLGGGTGTAFFTQNKVARINEAKVNPDKPNAFNYIQWSAYENNYFSAIFIQDFQKSSAAFIQRQSDQIVDSFLAVNRVQKVFIGPKDLEILADWGYQTKKIVKFGLFSFISEILYRGLKIIHGAIPNWGIAIILLTILVKIIFFPLTYSSTKSMAKMQEIQPKVKAIKAKYKKAKQDIAQRRKMNEETMALYKEHSINPAGGCLPLLIQIPIFWGFFRLLAVAIEFRHAPFLLWITDLSMKDPFYVTPILMGITQFISQKMTPTSADSSQQKMMLIMPVVMTFFFMNFQSGLVLYWLTNNVLQIAQQYIMNRMRQKQKRDQHGKQRKKA
ncbi:MAG: membrane protein insertase YidC [Candidatus Aminicenantes bacterium]|nr:membrane protein insertase YidC [Candidatus Aminicenantes bacterium]